MFFKRSNDELEELRKRVSELESAVRSYRAPHNAKIGRVVDLLMDHLGISVQRIVEHDYVAKKGGPESPQ